ncbi:rhodanese (plasmid) [Salipiger sp. CCB-MM3]|uniref:PQQ-dependent catabolism-associated CXXCW motif protein n=1 Tax=Salipiger sp. CCB-MM3 TaxID=1792508 RepID=UPI00080ABFBB|nr:PQQ-dependent catabolism-associated CXXCW motif protein [Salipiger sp. CCB-MM3]ANT63489.1 rhodanese [Salipiger sp. CCB-MM3]
MKALAAVLMLLPALAFAQPVPEPEGYRMEAYRAPVPETLAGAQVVDADEAHALWQSGEVAFVDVLPQPPKPDNLPEGTVWRAKPRDSIPGAVWLPNTGYGALAEVDAQYFRDGLAAVTGGDRAHPLLIFCLAECWMSWNAAKRALAEGYAEVYWLPVGTDGWAAAGYPLERVTPRQ